MDELELALLMRAYTRRTQFEARVLARAVVEALSEAMQPAEGAAAGPGCAAAPSAAPGGTVPPARLMALMGIHV